LVAARHGIAIGLAPVDIALHRFVWAGLILTPLVLRSGLWDLGGIGWRRAIIATFFGGPFQAVLSYTGFITAPLGHGAVIQPAASALSGLILAALLVNERLSGARLIGALIIVAGLTIFGAEAITVIGAHGLIGDLSFAVAGVSFGIFAAQLRRWNISGPRAAVVVGFVSLLIYAPIHGIVFGYQRIIAAGLWENVLQVLVQGVLTGSLTIYMFARAVTLIGAGRAATFSALVPGFAMVIGYLVLGETPSVAQLSGLAVVLVGFRFVLKR
jgi:drug/metabolite transporter (DMT)-like permease